MMNTDTNLETDADTLAAPLPRAIADIRGRIRTIMESAEHIVDRFGTDNDPVRIAASDPVARLAGMAGELVSLVAKGKPYLDGTSGAEQETRYSYFWIGARGAN